MSTSQIEHNFISINGIRSHYLSTGQADAPSTVILLHGGGVDCAQLSWELLIPELTAEHRVLAPDWPVFQWKRSGSSAWRCKPPSASKNWFWWTAMVCSARRRCIS